MFRLALLLLPAALAGGELRFARLGEIEGHPEVQPAAWDEWQPALRNSPVLDGAWIRTAAGSRAEVELDEGSAFRVDADSLCEFSDYTRLSTGQRITLISLDRGLAYFTGAAEGRDSIVLAVPGAQAIVRRGTRVRLEAREGFSQIAVIEGAVTFSSPAAEIEITEGQLVRVEPANPSRFHLYREIPPLEQDRWSESRDKALASASPAHAAGLRYGVADLDSAGAWIDTKAWGTVWKPKVPAGWAPFRSGKWAWYEGLGYTWVSAEPWGWLPYHYGRWALQESGWLWVPGKDDTFSPGDVYWLRGAKLAGWGPLMPGEQWTGGGTPQLFLNAHTTFAAFVAEMREIDPAGFAAPKEPLAVARFVAALPSPALAAARLEAERPALRAGSTRVVAPYLSGVSYDPAVQPAGPETAAPVVNTTVIQPPPQPPVVVVTPPPEPPAEIYYPAPVYTGIVVVNPPERGDRGHRRERPSQRNDAKPAAEAPKPAPSTPAISRAEQVRETRPHRTPEAPKPAAQPLPRTEQARERVERAPQPPKPAETADKPLPRNVEPVSRGDSGARRGDPR